MWISRRLSADYISSEAEEATVTLEGVATETTGTLQTRDFLQCHPYGYDASLPLGTAVLSVPVASGNAVVGVATASNHEELKVGEVKLTALSGAYIYLRDDGSVVINGAVIDKNGQLATTSA